MVEVSNNFIQECEANVGTYKFGKIKVNYIDDNPFNYEQGAYSSSNGTKIDAEQSIRYNKLVECKPNFKYKIELGNSAYKMKIVTYNANQAFIAAHDNLIQGSELTTEATAKYISVTIYSNDTLEGTNITLNNTIRNGEILGVELKGNTSQNGTPTPDAPIEVNNVTGEQVVTICGKNLFELYKTNTTISKNGIDVTRNNDGTITLNGTTTANTFIEILYAFQSGTTTQTNIAIPLENTKTYTLSINQLSGTTTTNDIRIAVQTNISDTQQVYASINNPNQITNSIGLYRGFLRISSGRTLTNLIVGIQLEQGTTVTTYEPYQGKDYEINLGNIELNKIGNYQDFIRKGTGKNLINVPNGTVTTNGVTGSWNNNFVQISGTNTKTDANWILLSTNNFDFPDFKIGETYTISALGKSNKCYVQINYNVGDTTTQKALVTMSGESKSFIVPEDFGRINFIFIGIYRTTGAINENWYLQLEKGPATSYEPYGYKDKWYIEKNIGKVVLDGSRNWTKSGNTNIDRFVLSGYVDYGDTNCFSNYFDNGIYSDTNYTKNQIFLNTYSSTKRIIINYSTVGTTTLADFKTWLQSNNTKVYYALANATYTLIENEELIEQLDAVSHAETQEGTTNITSSGILPAILEVTPNLIESIRGKQTTPIVGYNITGEDDLINFKITSKADSNGNILGATSQSQVDIEIFNENNTHNLENKQVYISTGLNETEGNYCKWQPFTITQTKDTQTKNHTTYTGYDDMMRGNGAYIDNVDYGEEGVTLYDFTCKLAKEMGMALRNTTMTNGDFIVKGNNFTNNEAKLVVLKNVAQMAGGFAMIDRDNLLRIVELSPEDAMTPIELTTNLYTEDFQNSAKFGEINEFAIGETNIETNAIVRSDDTSIAKNGVKKIEILDNMFLGLLEDKEIAIEPLWDAFNGFSYYPFKTPYNGYPYIDLGDKINITDINSNVYSTLVLNNVFEYNGGYKGNIGAEALSITAAKYKTNNTLSKQFRKVGIDIDRVEGKITSEIDAATDGITKAYNSAIDQSATNINLSVTEINKVLSGDPAVEGDTGLEGTVNKINQTYLTVDSNDFTVVSSTATEAKKKADAVEENTQKIVSQLHFDAETGLTISAEGSTDDDMKLNLTNSQVNFMYRNSPVLVINGNKIEFTGATFQKFDLGNYVWQAEDDDSLSLIYEGD